MGIEGLNPAQLAKLNDYAKKHNISIEQAKEELMFDFAQEDPVDGFKGGQLEPSVVKSKKVAVRDVLGAVAGVGIVGAIGLAAAGIITGPAALVIAGVGALTLISCNNKLEIKQEVSLILQNGSVDKLIEYFEKNQKSNEEIVALLKENNRNQADILKVLIGMNNKMDEIITLIGNNTDLLVEISHNNDDIKGLLTQIKDKVAQGVEINVNNNALLKEILSKLSKLGDNDAEKIALLKEILAKVTESVENNKDTDAKTLDLLQAILAKIDTMNENQKAFFTAVIAKIGDMGEKGKAALEAILKAIQNNTSTITAAIEGLGKDGKVSLEAILKAINEGNKIATGSQDVLVEILANLDKLGGKADTIINLIQNISVTPGGHADLSKVEKLLESILAQEEKNGEVLVEIDNKIKAFRASIEAKLETATDDIKKLLKAILEKIPPEHECDHSTIIEILLQIVDVFNKHEGTDQPGTDAYNLFNDLFA